MLAWIDFRERISIHCIPQLFQMSHIVKHWQIYAHKYKADNYPKNDRHGRFELDEQGVEVDRQALAELDDGEGGPVGHYLRQIRIIEFDPPPLPHAD